MDLSFIITHHNTPELLCLCLDSIKNNVQNIKYEIIVVDSESKETTKELIQEQYAKIKFIPFKKNTGYSKIANVGIKESRGKYVLILNADIIVLEKSISKMLEYIENHPDVGMVGPQLLDFTNNIQISYFSVPGPGMILARRTFLGKTKWGKKQIADKVLISNYQPVSVDWLQGSAIMVRKEALKKVGLLDERFFMYFEDADWCRRFRQNGYKVVYLPTAKMVHYYHRSSKKWGGFLDLFFNRYTRIHLISAFKYFWKYR